MKGPRGRLCKVGYGSCGNLTAPAVLYGHHDPKVNTQVAYLTRPGQTPHSIDLKINQVHRIVLIPTEQDRQSIHTLVEDKWQISMLAHGKALFITQTRLLNKT